MIEVRYVLLGKRQLNHRMNGRQLTFALLHQLLVPLAPWFQFSVEMAFRAVKCVRIKVNAAFGFVAIAVRDDLLYELGDLRNEFGYSREGIGSEDTQAIHVLEKRIFPEGS